MPAIAVTGAVLACNKGTLFTPLKASGGGSVQLCGLFAALVTDVSPGANISPFGICAVTKTPCGPATVGTWTNPMPSCVSVNARELATNGAKLPCVVGGEISIMTAAQALVVTSENRCKVGTEPSGGKDAEQDDGGLLSSAVGALGSGAVAIGRRAEGAGRVVINVAPKAAKVGGVVGALGGMLVFPDSTSPNDVMPGDYVSPAVDFPSTGPYRYRPPKRKGRPANEPVPAPGQPGYLDKKGRVWTRDGDHWDVKNPTGEHTNVGEDGQVHHGPDNFGVSGGRRGRRKK